MIAAPPSLDGAVQLRLMVVCPEAVAVSEVGAPGAVAVAAAVMALTTLEAELVPPELMALTR